LIKEHICVMRSSIAVGSIAALGSLAIAAGGPAYAVEPGSSDPHEPGVSNGVAGGALPPSGFYFINTLSYQDGSLRDGNGNPTTISRINVTDWIEIPAITWVTPWHFLGASYAVAIAQPLVTLATTTNGGTENRSGVFNTVLNPAILSWTLPAGFFVSASLPIYLQDGDTGDRGTGTLTSQAIHIANNTTTFARAPPSAGSTATGSKPASISNTIFRPRTTIS
jgi:hypothetical protein